jgi:hypothetical protein
LTWILLFGALLVCGLVWPSYARAQPAGYYVTPSLTLSSSFDDNVFVTSTHREADVVFRLTPGLSAGYRSLPFTILGSYAFDVENYAAHHDLDNVADRQVGTLELRYLPHTRLTLALNAVYAKTNRPVELSRQPGLQPIARAERGLEESTALTLSPSVTYRFAPLWSATGGYSYAVLEGGGTSTTLQEVNVALSRRFTAMDTGLLKYIDRRFEDDTGAEETSHTIVAGWTRRLSAFTTVTVQAGPRFQDDKVDAEVLASVQHRLKFADLFFSYSRTEAITVGESGTVVTDTLTGQASFRPLQYLQVSIGPSVQRSTPEGRSSRSEGTTYYYSIGATASYRINTWLTGRVGYSGSLQDSAGRQILHNVLSIGLTASYPIRTD